MQTHAQQAVNALGLAALDLPVIVLAAIQKDAMEARLTRAVLTETRAITPSSRTKRLLDERIPALDSLHAEQSDLTVPNFAN